MTRKTNTFHDGETVLGKPIQWNFVYGHGFFSQKKKHFLDPNSYQIYILAMFWKTFKDNIDEPSIYSWGRLFCVFYEAREIKGYFLYATWHNRILK